jgi:hypothetical protein
MIAGYLAFLPFIFWWDPYEPRWFVLPNLFACLILGRYISTQMLSLRARAGHLLALSVVVAATWWFAVWPRRADISEGMQLAQCVASHMTSEDALLATDWNWPGYLAYLHGNEVIGLIGLAVKTGSRDGALDVVDAHVRRVNARGGHAYIAARENYTADAQRWFTTQAGIGWEVFDRYAPGEAFGCRGWTFLSLRSPA